MSGNSSLADLSRLADVARALLAPLNVCGLKEAKSLTIAVSGGSDSTALLLGLAVWRATLSPDTRVVAVTIDHALRAESAAEAETVSRLATSLGVEHRTVKWTGPKPSTGLPAAAREARYQLLAQAAHEAGSDIILTGHTADDQVETILMRRKRGAGVGLSGMAPATLYDSQIWILRPFLNTRRDALRECLRSMNIAWADDPTNTDTRYERAALRVKDDWRDDEEFDALLAEANIQAAQRLQLANAAAEFLQCHACMVAPGLFHLDADFFAQEPRAAMLFALRTLLASTGGSAMRPDETRTAELARQLAQPPFRTTLSRTVIASRRDGVWLARERRDLPKARPAIDRLIWDGRYRVMAACRVPGPAVIRPRDAKDRPTRQTRGAVPQTPDATNSDANRALQLKNKASTSLLEIADAGAPVIKGDAKDDFIILPVIAPYARFLPVFDFALAQTLAKLSGCSPFPLPPPCA